VSAAGIEVFPRETSADGVGARWKLRLATSSFGRSSGSCELDEPAVSVRDARVELDRGPLVEWLENRPEGIEQGWTVEHPPPGGGRLWIGLALGGLSFQIEPGERSGTLLDAHGFPVLRYEGLRAFDALGRELGARLGWAPGAGGDLAIEVDDAGARYPLTVDPLLTLGWTGEGNQSSAHFGESVSGAGDVNGDGYDDVIVGARQYDNGEDDEGRAFVFLGSAAGLATTPAWMAESDQAVAYFGRPVSAAGDVNGDGFGDVLVGASVFNSVTFDEGRVYVFHGSAAGLSPSPDWIVDGQQTGEQLGYSVSGAGDVNGDGFDDVIVGSVNYDGITFQVGRAAVYAGSPLGLSTVPIWSAEGSQSQEALGESVTSAGDVNADGYDDVVVGAPGYDPFPSGDGRALLYLGSPTGPSPLPDWTAVGSQQSENFGDHVSSAGDVDGDGYDDLLVGASRYGIFTNEEGRAYLFLGTPSGLASSPAWIQEGNQADARFAIALSGAGDVNADGYDDAIVGASLYDNGQTNEGRVFLYLGSPRGLGTSPAWTAESNQPSAFFGTSVSRAGDVDGNGYDDVIVGAWGFDAGQSAEGRAFVYLGQPTASHAIRNGDGTNPLGYSALTEPLLGQPWQLAVDLATPGHAASLVAFGLGGPVSGPTLSGLVQGQLLVLGPLFVDVAAGSHAIALPADLSLFGALLATQGASLDPGVVRLTNAIDATPGY